MHDEGVCREQKTDRFGSFRRSLLAVRATLWLTVAAFALASLGCQCNEEVQSEACVLRDGAARVYSKREDSRRPINRLPAQHRVEVHRQVDGWSRIAYRSPLSPNGERREMGWVRTADLGPCEAETRDDARDGDAESPSVTSRSVRLCWWNNQRQSAEDKDSAELVELFAECDLVGLAQVRSDQEASSMARALGPTWAAAASSREPTSAGAQIGYTLLFDRSWVSLGLPGASASRGLAPGQFEAATSRPWALPLRIDEEAVVVAMIRESESSTANESSSAALDGARETLAWLNAQFSNDDALIILVASEQKPAEGGWSSLAEGWAAFPAEEGEGRQGRNDVADAILINRSASRWRAVSAGIVATGDAAEASSEERSERPLLWLDLELHQR